MYFCFNCYRKQIFFIRKTHFVVFIEFLEISYYMLRVIHPAPGLMSWQ